MPSVSSSRVVGPRLTLSVAEFAARLGVSTATAYRLAAVHGVKVRGRVLVPVSALDRLLSPAPPVAAAPVEDSTADLADELAGLAEELAAAPTGGP